jgi:hypothetical protein
MSSANPYNAPVASASGQARPMGARSLHIKKIDPISAGKVGGAVNALVGLIIGLFWSLLAVLGAVVGGGGVTDVMLGGVIFGIGAVVFMPLFYGVAGLIGGLIGGLLYNAAAGLFGGFVLEVEG